MRTKIDLTGKRFSRLLVLGDSGKRYKNGDVFWICQCDCGEKRIINGSNLRNGTTTSCGCYKIEMTIKRNFKHGQNTRKKTTSEYSAWGNLISRCYNIYDKRYKSYGGRGIKVCDRWRNDFMSFFKDMGKKPSTEYSIDRIDNDKDYYKENCRWGTNEQQFRNKTDNHWIEYNGERKILSDWAKDLKAHHSNLIRMMKNKSFEGCVEYYKNIRNT